MDIQYGRFRLTGDFILKDFKERGFDRDYYVDPGSSVLNLKYRGMRIQFPRVRFLNFRASSDGDTVTVHVHSEEDLLSSIANFQIGLVEEPISIRVEDYIRFLVIPSDAEILD